MSDNQAQDRQKLQDTQKLFKELTAQFSDNKVYARRLKNVQARRSEESAKIGVRKASR